MSEVIREFISKYITLPLDEWRFIKKEFTKEEYGKETLILANDQICRYFYFLEEGLIRFFYNVDGDDITKTFTIGPYFFTSTISFRNQSPARESIQALDDVTVWKINYEQYRKLEQIPSWNLFMRKLLNEIQEYTEQVMLETKTRTAEQRYHDLLMRYPDELIGKVPLKHLSSYLGIAPQSLSRIRKKQKMNSA